MSVLTLAATPTLTPTAEQQDILDAVADGGSIAISAAAGAGKTSTLRFIANAHPAKRMLYVAYNKAIQVEAEASFPVNVVCKTAHALAYREFGSKMRSRLNGPRQTGKQNARTLGIWKDIGQFNPAGLAGMALATVAKFCGSADPVIDRKHFVAPEGVERSEALCTLVVPLAQAAWDDLSSPNGKLKPTHDVYLKQWALSNPMLAFDVVLYDEAQDADPCIGGVVEAQKHAQLIAVGDSAQAIYGWRGATDFLERMTADHRLSLTQSWRFGPTIADEANVWLGVVGTDLRVVGSPHRESTIGACQPDAVLCRTNAGTIEALLDAHVSGSKVHLVGDGKDMLSLARAAERMQAGEKASHPDLIAFRNWEQVVHYAENDPGGSDLAVSVRMIDKYTATTVVEAIEQTVPAKDAALVVSTAHKSKGLEWNNVRIANDYRQPMELKTGAPLPIPKTDAMLAYVSVTRAKSVLDNSGLAWVHSHLATLKGTPTR